MPCAEVNKASSVLCIAIWLIVLLVANQSVPGERLPIKVYTTADGLVNDHINRIVRDSRGFLWFCTSEGLSRFDGYKFTNYGTDQGLPNRQVNDFLETRNGEYWVATPGGLCRFNPLAAVNQPRFIIHRLGDDHASQITYALAEDRDGTLWCGTESSLYRMTERNGEWASYAVDLGSPTRYGSADAFSLVADQRGGLWILSASGLYRHRTDGIVERYAAQEGISVTDNALLFGDHLGKIWLGTSAGLYQLVADPQPGRSIVARLYTTKDGMGASGVSCMYQSSDERLWIGTWNGLNEFLPSAAKNGPQFRTYSSANGIRDVTALSEDRDRNLWMGTGTNGATKIAANGFTTYTEADGLRELRIAQISEDREGEICVFSGVIGQGHINRFDGRAFIPA